MEIISPKPLLAVLVSLAASVLIVLSRRHENVREFWTILASLLKFGIVASILPAVLEGHTLYWPLFSIPEQISLALRVDALGLFFGLLASFLWVLTSLYSIGYMRSLEEHAQTRYYACFAITLSATLGVAFSANLLTLFIFYEVLTLFTYPLVLHKETPEAKSAGRKYLAYTLSGGMVLLLGILLTHSLVGTRDFVPAGFLSDEADPTSLKLLFCTLAVGFGVKSTFVPFHAWLPTAMIAPTPVSALLHAVAVVKAGIFGILRTIHYVFGQDLIEELGLSLPFAYFVSLTILLASLFALVQDNLKRRLAYSTISQLSYIALGASLPSAAATLGGLLHFAYHAFMKITLFFCAGAIYVALHKENVSELDGAGRKMPITMLIFFLCALGMCGFPPVCGFISKLYLLLGAAEAYQLPLLGVLIASSLLNAAYFFPIVFQAFFRGSETEVELREAPPSMLVPLSITALAALILGVVPENPLFELARAVERSCGRG